MYNIYLGGILLPVAPGNITTKTKNNNRSYTLMNEGEVNILKDKGLDEINFTFLLPKQQYSFTKFLGGVLPITYYLNMLEKMKKDKKPITFVVLRDLTKINQVHNTSMLVSVESFNPVEDVGEYGQDMGIAITLREYKEKSNIVVDTLSAVSDVMALAGTVLAVTPLFEKGNKMSLNFKKKIRETNKETPKTYTIQDGDILIEICKKYLGDESFYENIAALNNIPNPFELEIGKVIRFE